MRPHALRLLVAASLAGASFVPTSSHAQTNPRLHVSPRWKECSIQLDSSLRQAAWRQFTGEAGELIYFRPLTDARPMGRGNFEVSLMQWQTNVDDNTSAWNDTFVHPDSTHWLHEGSGLQFPGLSARAGIGSAIDVGMYFTKNPNANYGVYGVQVQQAVVNGAHDWNVSARASFMALFGPEDVGLHVYGIDVVANWKHLKVGPATLTPYAGVATFLSSSHEKSPVITLDDERVLSAMGTAGAALQLSVVRVSAEASASRLPSFAVKVGIAR